MVADGIFSDPQRLDLAGAAEHAGAGGRVLAATEVDGVEMARGANVVVVGCGRSACDLVVALSDVAASTHVVARRLLHGPADRLRHALLVSLGRVSVRQLGLDRLGLVPPATMEDIVRGGIGLASEGFSERVGDGRVTVHRDRQIRSLLGGAAPRAALDDATVLAADLVVTATGYRQRLPFLDKEVLARLTDDAGDLLLHRQLLPIAVDDLTFAGYDSSFCPLGAEIGAHRTARLRQWLLPVDPSAYRSVTADLTARHEPEHTWGVSWRRPRCESPTSCT